jgi:hypothetical protein
MAVSYDSGDEIQAVINGLDAITEKVIPAVIAANDLDHVEYEDTLAKGTLEAYDPFNGWRECAEFEATLEIEADFPVDSNDVTADFESNRVVDTDWDIDGAQLEVDVEVELGWGDHASNLFCLGWDIVTAVENLIGKTHLRAYADGLGGELKVAMKDASHSTIGISSVNNATLSFDEVDITKNDAINWLIDAGISIADMFGGSCSSLEDCVNDRIDDELNGKDILNQIKSGLNDAIAGSATVGGGTDGELNLDYAVLLAALSTNSENQFSTGWDVELTSDEAADACADDLRESSYGSVSSETLGGDVDLTAGFPLLSKAVYEIGKQGFFCRSVSGSVNVAEETSGLSTGNARADAIMSQVASGVGILRYSAALVPDGAIEIADAEENNRLSITLPVRLDDLSVTSSLGTPSVDADDPITADFKVTAEIDVDCENGLYLKLVSAALSDISGSVEINGETVDASEWEDDLQEAAEGVLDDVDAITIVPKVNSLDTLGLGIEIADVDIDSSSIHVAVNLTDDVDECEDDDGGNGGGGGGGGDPTPGPGVPRGGFIIPNFDDDEDEWDEPADAGAAEMQTSGF